jgi:hypothetical protein
MIVNVKKYLQEHGFKFFQPDVEKPTFFLGIGTSNGKFQCIVDVQAAQERLLMLSIFPTPVPQHLRASLAELLIRINYNLFLGHFELDFTDGEIRFKTSLIYADAQVTPKMIDAFVTSNLTAMDAYSEWLTRFVTEQFDASEMVAPILPFGRNE